METALPSIMTSFLRLAVDCYWDHTGNAAIQVVPLIEFLFGGHLP
jgi:hypothetical protein